MKTLQSAVVHRPTFQKVAGVKLPKNTADWNEMIIKQFYTELSYLPVEYKVDAVVNTIDDKTGCAKGSVVVWNDSDKINFPVIIKDWELSPFDTFVKTDNDESSYRSATEENITKAMYDERFGDVANSPVRYASADDIKRPGGITPKTAIDINEGNGADTLINKMASAKFDWKASASQDDLAKFAEKLQANTGVKLSLIKNNPTVVEDIVVEGNRIRESKSSHSISKVDSGNVIKRKAMATVSDIEMFDVNGLKPLKGSTVAELRVSYFPTMEEFIACGDTLKEKVSIAANGKPIKGAVFDIVSVNPKKEYESKKDHKLFISANATCYAMKSNYGRPAMFGEAVPGEDNMTHIMASIADKSTTLGLSGNRNELTNVDGYDKVHSTAMTNIERKTNKADHRYQYPKDPIVAVLFKSGDTWKALKFDYQSFRTINVNSQNIYVSDKVAIIKSKVNSPVAVNRTEDPTYSAVIGIKPMVLVPEDSIVLNLSQMNDIRNDILSPDDDIRHSFDASGIKKVALQIGKEGICIKGSPVAPLMKIAGMSENQEFSTDHAIVALHTLGMSKEAAKGTLGSLVKRAMDGEGNSITVYNVNENYIDTKDYDTMGKMASFKGLLKEYADSIRTDLVKEASVVEDPEAVDNLLSLNFITEDNILDYANYTDELRETSDKMSELLIANRMGLKDVDEAAIKKSVEGLEDVIQGLNKLKLVVGTR